MKIISSVIATGLLSLCAAPIAFADAEVDFKYREKVMEAVGGHMGAMGTILKNGIHPEDLTIHASAIAALADVVPHVFPAGSGVEKSKAKPAIWKEPEKFAAAVEKFVGAAQDMADAADGGDMAEIGPAIQALGGSCKGCHDDYKAD